MSSSAYDDVAAVQNVVRDYIDGWHAGDPERMERSLHDALVKQTLDEAGADELRRVTKARMVELTRDGGGGPGNADATIAVHHVEGDIASARVETGQYLDYVHLVRSDGSWRIVHDLFRLRG